MQSDIDAQLTNFFEDAPPREFATVMRGYDRHQVDEHIRAVEAEARTHKEQAQSMRRERRTVFMDPGERGEGALIADSGCCHCRA